MNIPIADNYGWNSNKSEKSHSYLIPSSLKIINKYKVTSLLDIGTGNGASIPVWLSEGLKVAAMEPDNDGYLFSKKYTDADVRQIAVGETVPPEWKNAFDAIISLEVIEHLFDPEQLIKTIEQSLKINGIVILSTPYHGYLKNLALAFTDKWDFHHHPTRIGGHIKFWSRKTLRLLFEKAGFQQISFCGVGRIPFLWKSMIVVFKKSD
jgi:2-polyprenyl-3-methyl-5-hydroxy-6-metoxy-1,4-benzoquinol methylase